MVQGIAQATVLLGLNALATTCASSHRARGNRDAPSGTQGPDAGSTLQQHEMPSPGADGHGRATGDITADLDLAGATELDVDLAIGDVGDEHRKILQAHGVGDDLRTLGADADLHRPAAIDEDLADHVSAIIERDPP